MNRLTQKETLHTNRVYRVLTDAMNKLEKLAYDAEERSVFPKTTEKAYIEVSEILNKTKARVFARNSSVV